MHKQPLTSIQTIHGNGQILENMDEDDLKSQCDQLESGIAPSLENQSEEHMERNVFHTFETTRIKYISMVNL